MNSYLNVKKYLDKGLATFGAPLLLVWFVFLPAFFLVQLQWLNRLRDADAAAMRETTTHQASLVLRDFQDTVESITRTFNLKASPAPDMLTQIASGWDQLDREKAKDLVSGLYLIEQEQGRVQASEYLPWNRELAPVSWPESMKDLASLWAPQHTPFDESPKLFPHQGVLILPCRADYGQTQQWVAAVLNESYLAETLIPKLAYAYFLRGSTPAYHVAVVDTTGNPRFLYRSDLDLPLQMAVASETRFNLFEGLDALTANGQKSTTGWELLVQHQQGSFLAAANVDRNANATILLVMSVVIGVAFLLPARAARRNQTFASNQLAYFSGLSHDLCAPLSVISSAAYNLTNQVVAQPDRVRLYGSIIRKESSRLHEMVSQVLEYSRAHSDVAAYQKEEVTIDDWIHTVMHDHQSLLQNKRIETTLHIEEGLPTLSGDIRALKSALANLITNAAKYGGEHQWLGVRAFREGQHVCIEVADKGAGIPAAEQRHLFEPYYRATAAVASGAEGSGLGLSLVQKIMKKHGGTVSLRSQPGEGTAFTLSFPVPDSTLTRARGGLLWKKRFSW